MGGRKERGIYAQSDEGAESGLKEDSVLFLSYPSREMARWRVTEGWRVAVLCWEWLQEKKDKYRSFISNIFAHSNQACGQKKNQS